MGKGGVEESRREKNNKRKGKEKEGKVRRECTKRREFTRFRCERRTRRNKISVKTERKRENTERPQGKTCRCIMKYVRRK